MAYEIILTSRADPSGVVAMEGALKQTGTAAKDAGDKLAAASGEIQSAGEEIQQAAAAAESALSGGLGASEGAKALVTYESELESVQDELIETGQQADKAAADLSKVGGGVEQSLSGLAKGGKFKGFVSSLTEQLTMGLNIGLDQAVELAWNAGTKIGEYLFKPIDWDEVNKGAAAETKRLAAIRDSVKAIKEETRLYVEEINKVKGAYDRVLERVDELRMKTERESSRQETLSEAQFGRKKAEVETSDLPEADKTAALQGIAAEERKAKHEAQLKQMDLDQAILNEELDSLSRDIEVSKKRAEESKGWASAAATKARLQEELAQALARYHKAREAENANSNGATGAETKRAQRELHAAQTQMKSHGAAFPLVSADAPAEADKALKVQQEEAEKIASYTETRKAKVLELQEARKDKPVVVEAFRIAEGTQQIEDQAALAAIRDRLEQQKKEAEEKAKAAEERDRLAAEKDAQKRLREEEREATRKEMEARKIDRSSVGKGLGSPDASDEMTAQASQLKDTLVSLSEGMQETNAETSAALAALAAGIDDGFQAGEVEKITAALQGLMSHVNKGLEDLSAAALNLTKGVQSALQAAAAAKAATATLQSQVDASR